MCLCNHLMYFFLFFYICIGKDKKITNLVFCYKRCESPFTTPKLPFMASKTPFYQKIKIISFFSTHVQKKSKILFFHSTQKIDLRIMFLFPKPNRKLAYPWKKKLAVFLPSRKGLAHRSPYLLSPRMSQLVVGKITPPHARAHKKNNNNN